MDLTSSTILFSSIIIWLCHKNNNQQAFSRRTILRYGWYERSSEQRVSLCDRCCCYKSVLPDTRLLCFSVFKHNSMLYRRIFFETMSIKIFTQEMSNLWSIRQSPERMFVKHMYVLDTHHKVRCIESHLDEFVFEFGKYAYIQPFSCSSSVHNILVLAALCNRAENISFVSTIARGWSTNRRGVSWQMKHKRFTLSVEISLSSHHQAWSICSFVIKWTRETEDWETNQTLAWSDHYSGPLC